MKENKWVLALVVAILIAAGWYLYPVFFSSKADNKQAQEYDQGLRLIQEGKLEEAKVLLKKGIVKEPGEGKYHFALGNIARQQNKMDEALSHYEQTIQKSPELVEAYNNETAILMIQNKMDEALKAAEAGLGQDPAFKDLLFKKGQLLYVKKDYSQAISAFQSLLSDPAYVEVYRFIGLSLLQQKQYEPAVQQLKLYLQKTPANNKGRADVEKMIADNEKQSSNK